ncbi:hypothetical protein ALC60_05173 [Trachymyrmex zeteki]|uniref:Uncharacterized protein n=1 Tax=Mycetomoellerius zeteki TaxID=64791 RepID=A0A151X680_9HYME|nr:hypothetical protein ALC60_05173 [Trachymyrmex zeteki]
MSPTNSARSSQTNTTNQVTSPTRSTDCKVRTPRTGASKRTGVTLFFPREHPGINEDQGLPRGRDPRRGWTRKRRRETSSSGTSG